MDQIIMTDVDIKAVFTVEQIQSCYKIFRQLRPHFTEEKAFIDQVLRQLDQGYKIASFQEEGIIKAVIGFRFLEFLAWGKVLYIDDLITDSEARKKGYGTRLLKWVMELAKKENCDQIHLDSGPHRHDAHKLYLNNGFKIVCHHFSHSFKEIA